jgi:hypothetical protein
MAKNGGTPEIISNSTKENTKKIRIALTISIIRESRSMRAKRFEIGRPGQGTGGARSAPAHGLSQHHGAAAAAGLGHRRGRGTGADAVAVRGVAEVAARVQTRPAVQTEIEAGRALALERTHRVDAATALARTGHALVVVLAPRAVQTQFEARVAHALVAAVHVDAAAVGAHAVLGALVAVDAVGAVRRQREAVDALALVAAGRVFAAAVQTNARVFVALVDVDARVSGRRQDEARVAVALEGAVHVGALAVGAHAALRAFVVVSAGFAVRGNVKARRTPTTEAAGCVDATTTLGTRQLAV